MVRPVILPIVAGVMRRMTPHLIVWLFQHISAQASAQQAGCGEGSQRSGEKRKRGNCLQHHHITSLRLMFSASCQVRLTRFSEGYLKRSPRLHRQNRRSLQPLIASPRLEGIAPLFHPVELQHTLAEGNKPKIRLDGKRV